MPIKKDKRKKKITLLKQKQKQTQTQKVVINLADLVKRRPRPKPLVEPIPKKPSEMILTRVIREPAFTPYQHHINQPVKVSHAGLEKPPYVPENYNPILNQNFLEKMGPQPTPFQKAMEQTKLIRQEEDDLRQIAKITREEEDLRQLSKTSEFTPKDPDDDSDPRLLNPITNRYIKNTKANRDRIDIAYNKLADEEMERRRRNEAELFKQGGQDE
jgi:hypothetical protein